MRHRKVFLPVLAMLVLVGCSDQTLTTVAKDLDIAAQTVKTVQTTVIQANTQQLISEADTRTILEACNKVSLAGKEAVTLARSITTLDPASREKLVNLIGPAATLIGNLVQSGTLGITDPATKQNIQVLLASLQGTLNGINIALAGG